MNDDLDAYYELANNIDCSATNGWNDGGGFLSIGNFDNPFIGNFDGNNHTISGFYISNVNGSNRGLFGYTNNAVIADVGLVDAEVYAEENVGGLMGSGIATILNSYVTGTVFGEENAGGLVGYLQGGSITDCYSTANVTAEFYYGGGLVGSLDNGEIADSYATGSVEGGDLLGGFVGNSNSGLIGSCYSSGDVIGNGEYGSDSVGGFLGYASSSDITNCYATGDVSGVEDVGGFIGESQTNIENCYAAGNVTGEFNVGGFAGDFSIEGEIYIHSSFSTGTVTGGEENIGGFLGYTNMDYSNCGWVVQDGLNAIGGVWIEGELVGVAEIGHNETSGSAFFNKNHSLYASYEGAVWDFDNVWEENVNTYPTLYAIEADDVVENNSEDDSNNNPNDTADPQRAKVASWKAYEYTDSNKSCSERLKLTIKGRHFDKDIKVFIGGKEASSVNVKNSKKLTAKFCMTKLLSNKADHIRVISVKNPGTKEKKADKQIDLDKIDFKIGSLNSNSSRYYDPNTKEGIIRIQQVLNSLGYLDKECITGFYGPITMEAVKKFQADNGILQTGYVGPLTEAKLMEK